MKELEYAQYLASESEEEEGIVCISVDEANPDATDNPELTNK